MSADDPNATIFAEPTFPLEHTPMGETIELGERLAAGGMGEVLLGRQTRLARQVAVKRPRPDKLQAASSLVTEALVTGALEHPNIVPVYDLQEGPRGPLMVMKRLEGTVWTELIEHPGRLGPLLDGRSPLGFHIDVLLAVCDAVRFAHARGLVHRDLKTDNVMIGSYGEVTVLDWGLAVSVREEDRGVFPLARDARRVAGTPAFMAPEMVRADGTVDARTDVYLLGGILHVLLTGRPRHAGEDLNGVLEAALASEPPTWPDGVIPELATIAERATAADPADRYPTVAAFHDALTGYRHHVASLRLTAVARRRAGIHRSLVERELAGEEQDGAVIRAMAIEGRFGFRQALEAWTDNVDARRGLDDLIRWAARYELHGGNADAAAVLLDELQEPAPALMRQLDEVRARRALEDRAAAELEKLAWERDLSVFAGRRGLMGVALGGVVAALCFGIALLDRTGLWPIGYREILVGLGLFTSGVMLLTTVARRFSLNWIGRNEIRQLRWITAVLVLHWLGAWGVGLPIPDALAWNALLAGAMLIAAGMILDPAAAIAGSIYLPTWAGILALPGAALEIFALGNVVSYATFALWTGARASRTPTQRNPHQAEIGPRS